MVSSYSALLKVIMTGLILFSIFCFFRFLTLPIDQFSQPVYYYLLLLLFNPLLWKIWAQPLIYRVETNKKKGYVQFRRSFGEVQIHGSDVTSWGIKKPKGYNRAGGRPDKILIIDLKNGRKFVYSLKRYPNQEYHQLIDDLQSIWGSTPNDLGYTRLFKDEAIFWQTTLLL